MVPDSPETWPPQPLYTVPSQLYLRRRATRCRTIPDLHALELLLVPRRQLGVASGKDCWVQRGHHVLAGVDGEGVEPVVHDGGEVIGLSAGVHLMQESYSFRPHLPATHPPARVAALEIGPRRSTVGVALGRQARLIVGSPGIAQELGPTAGYDVPPVHRDVGVSVRPSESGVNM